MNNKKKYNKSQNPKLVEKVYSKIDCNTISRQELRKKHHIWMWLILFCPVAIYKSIKYKCFSKPINLIIIITLILCIFLGLDNMYNPDRVLNHNVKKSFINVSNEYDLGEFRFGQKIGTIDNKYLIYSVTSTKDEYDLYINSSNGENISAILSLTNDRKPIFASDSFKESFSNIYPAILRLFTDKDFSDKCGTIQGVDATSGATQTIKCLNGIFNFQVDKESVISVYKLNEDESTTKIYSNGNNPVSLPDELSNYLSKNKKNMGDFGNIITYTLNENNREYVIRMNNGNYHKLILYDNKTIEVYNAENNIDTV